MPDLSEAERIDDFWQLGHKLYLSAIQNMCKFGPKWNSMLLGATIENLDLLVGVKIEEGKQAEDSIYT